MTQKQKKIPNGWEEKKLGDLLVKIDGGGTPSKTKPEYWNGNIPWASVKDIVSHNPNDTLDHITEMGLANSSSKLISAGTLITSTRMALGHAVFFEVDVAINQDLKALYPNRHLDKCYLYNWFQSKKSSIEKLGNGSTVAGLQQNELKAVKVFLPTVDEQVQINEILKTWNKYLLVIKRKIEIKKKIKKGLMQQLLTGKKRLPGFSGEWNFFSLASLCVCLDNRRIPLNSQNRLKMKGNIPYCGANGIVDYIDKYIFDEDIILLAEDGGHFDEYNVRPIAYRINEKCWVNNHAHVIKAKEGVSQDLLFFSLVHKNILPYLNGGTRAKLNKSELLKIKIYLPKDSNEQIAIAQVLNSAEKELMILEKLRANITEQKKFLLNNLITGNIRLPEFRENKE